MSVSNACGQLGAIQTRGTCWFYSILNGFILSEDGQKILYNKLREFYKKLKPAEKAYFDDEFNAPCPMKNLTKTKEIYFWKFIDQYLCFMSGPRAASLKAGKSASILGGMSLAGTLAKKNQGGQGAFPQAEIAKILDHVGFSKDYYFKYASDPPKFHMLRKPQFVVVRRDKYYPKNYMDEIPKGLMADPKYEIMCASLVIANTNANKSQLHRWHAVAGFVCNGHGYIYDSNQRKVFKCNWWNIADFKKVVNEELAEAYSFFKGGQINVHQYAFAIFARKEFTKSIGVSCLMKYKTKTPDTYGINFTDPNAGNKINSKLYNYLKPAQRAALKRKWARTEHKAPVYINKATFNSIVAGAKNRVNGYQQVTNLESAGYKFKNEDYNNFAAKLKVKFPIKKASPVKTNGSFANVKARLNQYTKGTAAVRKHQYSLVWKGLPMTQRRVLMHWRNKGEWLANNAFENKPKPPIKRKSVAKPKPKTPSPSPHTKRAIQVKSNFEKYWKSMQPENRQMIRNYVAAYKSPSPVKPKSPNTKKLAPFFEPAKYTLANAKRNVNALTTAKARKEYKRTRAANMNQNKWVELGRYINVKNYEAMQIRRAKRAAKA
jgi:hypothetical protein